IVFVADTNFQVPTRASLDCASVLDAHAETTKAAARIPFLMATSQVPASPAQSLVEFLASPQQAAKARRHSAYRVVIAPLLEIRSHRGFRQILCSGVCAARQSRGSRIDV